MGQVILYLPILLFNNMQYIISIDTNWNMTTTKKIIVLLKRYPEIRNSYDRIIMKYREEFPLDTVTRSTIERNARFVQYDLELFPPSERTRRARKDKQKEIIANHEDVSYIFEKETFFQAIKRFFNF